MACHGFPNSHGLQISRFTKMILRDRHSTSYDLAVLFRGGSNTLDRWDGKSQNAAVQRHQLHRQHFMFAGSLGELLRFNIFSLHVCRMQNCFILTSSTFIFAGCLVDLQHLKIDTQKAQRDRYTDRQAHR